ncbi:uncharacterized protein ONO86_06020 [Micromonospora noduli]|nr:uncharacterized protein ONO86_06020 [Micromonospora noduli]
MPTASSMNLPITRLVKKPRPSLTTIGVLPIRRPRSNARASATSPVRSPTTISSNGIRSTGEKKCMPMKSAGRSTPAASPVIGRVEVLEASSASGASTGSTSAKTCCFSAGSSKTASMTASQPASASAWSVVVIRSRTARASASVVRPLRTARASSRSACSRARPAASGVTSLTTTSSPALAQAYAMPAPIMPAPSTATRRTGGASTSAGRAAPPLTAFRSKKNAPIMFLATCPVSRPIRCRVSTVRAVSRSTCAPSTAAARIASGAGSRAPLSCLRSVAGKAGSCAASERLAGVPPGIR